MIPVKNGEGCYVADDRTLDELEAEGRVVARYVRGNPNGSLRDIAAIRNAAGNVVGIMPHPEHAVEALTGPSIDGLGFFTSVLAHLGAPLADATYRRDADATDRTPRRADGCRRGAEPIRRRLPIPHGSAATDVGRLDEGPDTVQRASTPDEQPYAELGLRDDEYERIRQILGRRPDPVRAGDVLDHVERALLVQVEQGPPAPVRREGAAVRPDARRHRGERRRHPDLRRASR